MSTVPTKIDKIVYFGGEIQVDDDARSRAFDLQNKLQIIEKQSILARGAILWEIKTERLYWYLMDAEWNGRNLVISYKDDAAFFVWANQRFGWSRATIDRAVGIYERLYLPHTEWFDSQDNLPASRRLDWLVHNNRWKREDVDTLLIEAGQFSAYDWKVRTLEIEAQEQGKVLAEPEAEVQAAAHINRQIEHARRRSYLTEYDFVWTCPEYRRWIASEPCAVSGKREEMGSNHCAHIHAKGVGSSGQDFCNVIPLYHEIHRLQHDKGWPEVFAHYGGTLADVEKKAVEYTVRWLQILTLRLQDWKVDRDKLRAYQSAYGYEVEEFEETE